MGAALLLRCSACPARGPDRLRDGAHPDEGPRAGVRTARVAHQPGVTGTDCVAGAIHDMTTKISKRARLDAYLKSRAFAGKREPPIPRREGEGPAPLSFGQEGIWRRAQSLPGVPLYNETITIHRRGPLQSVALQRGLDEIVQRHEAWRTTFHGTDDGHVVQRVEPS